MTAAQLRTRRVELGLTVDEMAFALNLTEAELAEIEAGRSDRHTSPEVLEALERLEERFFLCCVGAP